MMIDWLDHIHLHVEKKDKIETSLFAQQHTALENERARNLETEARSSAFVRHVLTPNWSVSEQLVKFMAPIQSRPTVEGF